MPPRELPKIFLEARIMLTGYVLILLAGVVSGYWWVPIVYYFLPRFLGEPLVRFFPGGRTRRGWMNPST